MTVARGAQPLAPSNGTTAVLLTETQTDINFIAVENMGMFASFSLAAAPRDAAPRLDAAPRASVLSSIEHSIKEHASIWAELSKY